MARRGAKRHRARDVDAPGGVPARPHRLHGDGRLADPPCPRPHPARSRDRNPRPTSISTLGAERTDRICLALAEQLEEVAGPVAEMSGF